MEKIENLIAEIEKLTVLELADLVKAIEEKFGVSAAAAAVVAAPGAAAGYNTATILKMQANVVLGNGKFSIWRKKWLKTLLCSSIRCGIMQKRIL